MTTLYQVRALRKVLNDNVQRVPGDPQTQDFWVDATTRDLLVSLGIVQLLDSGTPVDPGGGSGGGSTTVGSTTIVNDLYTGGTAAALSAEMGKTLKAQVDAKAPLAGTVRSVNGTAPDSAGNVVVAVSAGSVAAGGITDATAAGRALLTAADAAAQRTAMGLGSAATQASSAFAAAGAVRTVNGSAPDGAGNVTVAVAATLMTQVAYSTTIPVDGNKYMPRTAVSAAVQFTLGAIAAGGQCKVGLVADGVNIPTFGAGITVDPAGDTYANAASRVNNIFFWSDGDVVWATIKDTGINVTATAATTVTLIGPNTVVNGVASSNFTVTANGSLASPVTVTPATNGGGTFTPASVTLTDGARSANFTHTPASTGVKSISITNNGGLANSPALSVTVNAAATVPGQVTGLTLGATTSTTQGLTWTVPPTGGASITDFVVQYAPAGSGSWTTFADGTSSVAAATVTGLSTSTTSYDYRVAAINSVGTGAYSATVTAPIAAAATVPGAPTSVVATGGNTSASVAFVAPASNGGAAITSYTVTASTGQTATGAASPINVPGLTNGTGVTFTVRATNSVGQGAASAASNSVTPQAAAPGTLADISTYGRALTAVNGAVVSTAQAQNGGGSVGLTAANSRVSVASDASLDLSGVDFTVELWVYMVAGGVYPLPISTAGSAAVSFAVEGGNLRPYLYAGGVVAISTQALTLGAWHHLAVVRSAGTIKIYQDGVQTASAANSTWGNLNSDGGLTLGNSGNYYLNGYMDDIRITKGVARYNGNFTPPGALPVGAGDPNWSNVTLLVTA